MDTRQASIPTSESLERPEQHVPASEQPGKKRTRSRADRPAAEAPAPEESPTPAPPAARGSSLARETFDWPQYGGGPAHVDSRELEDEIHTPTVQWFFPGCVGQPTLEGGQLYSGGPALLRLDPETGLLTAVAIDIGEHTLGGETVAGAGEMAEDPARDMLEKFGRLGEKEKLAFLQWLENLEDGSQGNAPIVPAPVVTPERVFARRAQDGGVLALDRKLGEELWRWDSDWDTRETDSPSTRVPLCLTGDGILLVALHDRLIALRASNGHELWRYPVNGVIGMVPAESGGRVFFGTDRGLFVALSASTGGRLWQAGCDAFGSTAPVVVGGRVFAAEGQSWTPVPAGPSEGKLRAWDVRNGVLQWESPLFRGAKPGGIALDESGDRLVSFAASSVCHFDLTSGKRGFEHLIEPENYPRGTPAVVGASLVLAQDGGRLCAYELDGEHRLRWAFQLPGGGEIEDFVATGQRIYVATTLGLFCLADDPDEAPPDAGYVLEWDGNRELPSFLGDVEAREK